MAGEGCALGHQEISNRYGLALSLVPDETAAAELFMRARNEAELRRLSTRWRAQQGLPEVAVTQPLPELSSDQQELALYLARRGARRRRLRPVLAALGAALLLAAAFFTPALLNARTTGLLADETFIGASLAQSAWVAEHRLSVYRAEAVPGAITFWWELRGPRAGTLVGAVQEHLKLADITALETEAVAQRKDRLVGRSVFAILPTTDEVGLHLNLSPDDRLVTMVKPTRLEQDPAARKIHVGRPIKLLRGFVTVDSVGLSPHATTVALRFSAESTVQLPVVLADGAPLRRAGTWTAAGDRLETELVLEPIPEGTEQLRIWYSGEAYVEPVTLHLPGPATTLNLRVEGDLVEVRFQSPAELEQIDRITLVDDIGRSIPIQPLAHEGEYWWLLHADLSPQPGPPGFSTPPAPPIALEDLSRLELLIHRQSEPLELVIDLAAVR